MSPRQRLNAMATVVCLLAAGCGGSATSSSPPPPDRIVHARDGSSQIVLTGQGAQRIGLRTAVARASGAGVQVPFSAIVYDSSGQAYVYTNTQRLRFSQVRVDVGQVGAGSAYLSRGVQPGARVVTVGAQELLGAQSGVLAQS